MKCQQCGTEHNANFCPNCGAAATQQPSSNFKQTANISSQTETITKPKRNKSPGRIILGIIICLAGLSLLVSAITNWNDNTGTEPTSNQSTISEQSSNAEAKGKVTYENFEKIENGMTYEQVVEIFGKEGKIISEVDMNIGAEYATTVYYWYDYTGIANCNVTIQGGKVVAKAQVGLR